MNSQSLKSQILEKLEILPQREVQTVLDFVDFLASRTVHSIKRESTQTDTQSGDNIGDNQLESIGGVLVLKVAKEPVEPQVLETALQNVREVRFE